ncbi:hypothetical protein [Micromonospora echinospora]|uniref:hypothetical protein n=1 Tax=Micromonospora echinospora TaxID=1877 RepID=UPI0012FD9E1B|nr:hypothetical protein [Micromonospora echinospora]
MLPRIVANGLTEANLHRSPKMQHGFRARISIIIRAAALGKTLILSQANPVKSCQD